MANQFDYSYLEEDDLSNSTMRRRREDIEKQHRWDGNSGKDEYETCGCWYVGRSQGIQ